MLFGVERHVAGPVVVNVKNPEIVDHSIAVSAYVDTYWKVTSYSPAEAVRVSHPHT